MTDCIFCKIARGEIPSNKAYEDDYCLAFYDLEPQAPVHLLIIPKEHIAGGDAIDSENSQVVGHIFGVIPGIMAQLGVTKGWRVVTNIGEDGGQTVRHLHFHVLAGRELGWPPG